MFSILDQDDREPGNRTPSSPATAGVKQKNHWKRKIEIDKLIETGSDRFFGRQKGKEKKIGMRNRKWPIRPSGAKLRQDEHMRNEANEKNKAKEREMK